MKSCTMRISSMHGHLDLVGDTTGETESGTLSEHTDFEVTRFNPQTPFQYEIRRRNAIRGGTSRKCEGVRHKERILPQKGSSEIDKSCFSTGADR